MTPLFRDLLAMMQGDVVGAYELPSPRQVRIAD